MSIVPYRPASPAQNEMSLAEMLETCARLDTQLLGNLEALIYMDALSHDYAQNRELYAESVGAHQRSKWTAETERNLGIAGDAWHRRRDQEIDIARKQLQFDAERDPANHEHVLVKQLWTMRRDLDGYKGLLAVAQQTIDELRAELDEAPSRERHMTGRRPRPFERRER